MCMYFARKDVGSMQRSREDEGMKRKGETPREELGNKIQKQRRVEYTTFQKWQICGGQPSLEGHLRKTEESIDHDVVVILNQLQRLKKMNRRKTYSNVGMN